MLSSVDLKQAFDRVRLNDVFHNLRKRGIDEKHIKNIEELNRNNTTKIKIKNSLTEVVPINTGIRQGDSLSPILFNIIMDEIIKNVIDMQIGYNMGNRKQVLCYADDAMLMRMKTISKDSYIDS